MFNVNELSIELDYFIYAIQQNISLFTKLIGAIWLINIINWSIGGKLNFLGLRPRSITGLIGIFTGTFLHKNFNHLFFNSIPLVALGMFMLSFGTNTFLYASGLIILLEGITVWLIGRQGIHIGASSLISGYFSFILVSAYNNPSFTSIIITLITIYYFGCILMGILPTAEKTSWEGHLFGFIAGISTYFVTINTIIF